METYSQVYQDLFVISAVNNKRDGYFLEIGSNHPIHNNNSYLLEKSYYWKGLMVEYDSSFENSYKQYRPNSVYEIKDATLVNYKQLLDENNFPKNIDYLQIDLDVDNKSTLKTLQLLNNTVFDNYKFATITFEHDIYRGNYFDTQSNSREIFKDRGYILLFPDVSVFWEGSYKKFEDWYVHPELVENNYISKMKQDTTITADEIYKLLSL